MEGCTSSIFERVQDIDEMYMWFQFEEASSSREKVIAITRKCTTVMYIYVPYIKWRMYIINIRTCPRY